MNFVLEDKAKIFVVVNKNMKKGFTLLEMIIYIAIFSIFIIGFFSFSNNIINSRIHNQNIIEVNTQGSQIINVITQNIRNGSSIEILSNDVLVVDDIVFSKNNNILYFEQGSNDPIALHNERVLIDNLSFLNLSQDQKPDIVRIRFNLNSAYNNYSNSFYGTASLRKYE